MSEHIERMKIELEELQEKIKKEKDFLHKEKDKKESEKILDDNQRINLATQLMYMDSYAECLKKRIEYDKTKESNSRDYRITTSDKYAKDYGFKNWEDFEENGDYHIEKTEDDMKVWFLEDFSDLEKIKILEGEKDVNYGCWDYLADKDLWIYKYL